MATLLVTVVAALANYAVVPEIRKFLALDNSMSSPDNAVDGGDRAPHKSSPIDSQQHAPPAEAPNNSGFRPARSLPISKSISPLEDSAPNPKSPASVVNEMVPAGTGSSTGNSEHSLQYILESDFDDQVLKEPGPVLVFFCTDYEDPCRIMTPTIALIAQERQAKLKVIAIDVNINKELAERYGARSWEVPITALFSGGVERGRITGAASKMAVEHLIDNPQAFGKKTSNQDPLEAITNIPESDFNDQVLKAEIPVLVYFYSPNDACKQVSPLVSQVASEHRGRLRVVKVDSYSESRLAAEYDAGDYHAPC
jgi:thioredoxin 1